MKIDPLHHMSLKHIDSVFVCDIVGNSLALQPAETVKQSWPRLVCHPMQDGKLVLVSRSQVTRSVAKTIVSNTKSTDVLLMMNVVTAATWPFARLKSFVTFQPRMKSKASSQQRHGLRYSSSYGMHMGGVIWCGPTRGSGMFFGVDLL